MRQTVAEKFKLLILTTLAILIPIFFTNYLPNSFLSVAYAISLTLKNTLVFILPVLIFSFVFSCLMNLGQGAILYIILLVSCVFISNLCALTVGYTSFNIGMHFFHLTPATLSIPNPLLPAWQFTLPKLLSNDIALIVGFITGIYFSRRPNTYADLLGKWLNQKANAFLKNIFIPTLPVFIFGFVCKLAHDQVIQKSINIYGPILLLILATQWIYLLSWYFAAARFNIKKMAYYLKNVLPATLTGFSTISSAASMPVLLLATKKNLADDAQAEMLVPTIINIHTLGSAIGLTILALATLVTFQQPLPSVPEFFIFAFFTALAKFAVAAVPGGVVIVMTPIMETYLGFSGEMSGLVTAIYLMLDPFGTAANVTGNGVFPLIFSKLYRKITGK